MAKGKGGFNWRAVSSTGNKAATISIPGRGHTGWITRKGSSINLCYVAEAIIIGVHLFNSIKTKTIIPEVIAIGIEVGYI